MNNNWHKYEDEIPTEEKEYLVCIKALFGTHQYHNAILNFTLDPYKVDKYDFNNFKGKNKRPIFYDYSEYGYYEVTNVTHWMELPELPD